MSSVTQNTRSPNRTDHTTIEDVFLEQNNTYFVGCTHTVRSGIVIFKLVIDDEPPYRGYVEEKKSEFEELLNKNYPSFREKHIDDSSDENTFYFVVE